MSKSPENQEKCFTTIKNINRGRSACDSCKIKKKKCSRITPESPCIRCVQSGTTCCIGEIVASIVIKKKTKKEKEKLPSHTEMGISFLCSVAFKNYYSAYSKHFLVLGKHENEGAFQYIKPLYKKIYEENDFSLPTVGKFDNDTLAQSLIIAFGLLTTGGSIIEIEKYLDLLQESLMSKTITINDQEGKLGLLIVVKTLFHLTTNNWEYFDKSLKILKNLVEAEICVGPLPRLRGLMTYLIKSEDSHLLIDPIYEMQKLIPKELDQCLTHNLRLSWVKALMMCLTSYCIYKRGLDEDIAKSFGFDSLQSCLSRCFQSVENVSSITRSVNGPSFVKHHILTTVNISNCFALASLNNPIAYVCAKGILATLPAGAMYDYYRPYLEEIGYPYLERINNINYKSAHIDAMPSLDEVYYYSMQYYHKS